METFTCNKCLKTFTTKSNYTRHTKRKIPCTEEDKIKYIENKNRCNYCLKVFASQQSLKRHLDGKCKAKEKDTREKEELMTKLIKEKNEQAKQMSLMMKDMEEMKQKIIKLEQQNGKRITVKGNINTQNIGTQNIQNNFKIIAYGKEDLSYIMEKDFKQILNKGFKSVPNLVEFIHFNKNKPENHNVYISNMRDNYVLIYDGEKWQLKERDDVLQEMIENKTDILSEKFDELINQLDESTTKKFRRFLDEKDEDKIVSQIKKDLKMLLYNNKKIPEKTREILELNDPKRIDYSVEI